MRSAILLSICARSAAAGAAPGVLRGVRRVESGFDVGRVGAGDLADRLAGDRRDVVEIFAGLRRAPLAADIVLVALGERRFEGDIEIDFGHALLPLSDAARRAALTVGSRAGAWRRTVLRDRQNPGVSQICDTSRADSSAAQTELVHLPMEGRARHVEVLRRLGHVAARARQRALKHGALGRVHVVAFGFGRVRSGRRPGSGGRGRPH